MSHTPGPWTNVRDEFVEAADGTIIVTEISGHGALQREANACLIAAAPELLEALKLAEEAMTREDFGTLSLVPKLRAAIEKAEGKQ